MQKLFIRSCENLGVVGGVPTQPHSTFATTTNLSAASSIAETAAHDDTTTPTSDTRTKESAATSTTTGDNGAMRTYDDKIPATLPGKLTLMTTTRPQYPTLAPGQSDVPATTDPTAVHVSEASNAWLKSNWKYLLIAGITVALLGFVIVFVWACVRRRNRERGDEMSRTPPMIPLELLDYPSTPRNGRSVQPRPPTEPTSIGSTQPPSDQEPGYTLKDSMRIYGEQFRRDQVEGSNELIPSLNTSPASLQATESIILDRLFERRNPGFPYRWTPNVQR
ncbi:hypothetical protein T440DRAFT_551588 [Plenodomus tracheiphilus IPT5]|uniref:Uncharacterized protein n=1 Tax=Plenodomus tracheiphilus IPT5 TaxID=1408161 RepID=A0A6A7BGT9_9PLEO|nr:hypothetical protein T440DRAFT_551588 [Plenodomus tracheiphilus IPT5]